jgi:hypothetical protein
LFFSYRPCTLSIFMQAFIIHTSQLISCFPWLEFDKTKRTVHTNETRKREIGINNIIITYGLQFGKNDLYNIIVIRDFLFGESLWCILLSFVTSFICCFILVVFILFTSFSRFPFLCFFNPLSIYWKHSYFMAWQKKLFEAPGFVKPINRMLALFALHSQSWTPGELEWSASKCFLFSGV